MKNGRHGFPPSILIENFLGLSWLVMACRGFYGFGIFGPPAAQLRLPVQEQRIAPASKSLGLMERFQREHLAKTSGNHLLFPQNG